MSHSTPTLSLARQNQLLTEEEIRAAFEIQILARRDWETATIVSPSDGQVLEDIQFRQAKIRKLNARACASADWRRRIEAAVEDANARFFRENLETSASEINLNYYRSPHDFFGWHKDQGAGHTASRRLSALVVLWTSPDLLGGEFQIMDPEIKTVPCAAGDILVFKTDLRHQVTPLIRGERVSLNMWWSGK